jgi:uncharacterized repeat protein (TIGR03803 family)
MCFMPSAEREKRACPLPRWLPTSLGTLYGEAGGGAHGFGVIFKLTRTSGGWKESVIYSFSGGKSGAAPAGGLVWDAVGNLYGTTVAGGTPLVCHKAGCGTVFELSPSSGGKWTETVLYKFGSCKTDGCLPYGGVIFDASGNLYGTTVGGAGPQRYGTVFELAPTSGGWTESILHSFTAGGDGAEPSSGLVFDKMGNLYGATSRQGDCDGCGTIFEVSPTSGGWQEKSIYVFSGGSDGGMPNGPLILGTAGDLYGTTVGGGTGNRGVVFELTPGSGGTWTQTVLQSFANATSDAEEPMAGLVFDTTGNLYGTASYGGGIDYCGGRGCGAVFKLELSGGKWTESVLHSFTAGNDGQNPTAAVIVEAGKLYGTTVYGGVHGDGIVFEVKP